MTKNTTLPRVPPAAGKGTSSKSTRADATRQHAGKAADKTPAARMPAKPSTHQRLSAKEMESFKNLLLSLRQKVMGNVSFLTQDSLKPMPITDENVDNSDCEFALTMAGNEQNLLYEIDEALLRIGDGTYGFCQVTGQPIGKDRLKAIPYTRFCVEAQAEQEGGKFRRRRPDLV